MAKLYLKDTSDITSVEVIGTTVVLKNWHNGRVMVLSFRAFDEMVEHVKEERSPNPFTKYDNPDPRCHYPFSPDAAGYCWSYAHHIDGTTGYENMEPRCMQCDCFTKSRNYLGSVYPPPKEEKKEVKDD